MNKEELRSLIINYIVNKNRGFLERYIKKKYKSLIGKFDSNTLEIDDLVQESYISIMASIGQWKPNGQKVTTWLIGCLDQHLYKYVIENSSQFRVPYLAFRKNTDDLKTMNSLKDKLDKRWDRKLIYKLMEAEDRYVVSLQQVHGEFLNLDITSSDEYLFWLSLKNGFEKERLLCSATDQEINNKIDLSKIFSVLNNKQRAVIIYHYYYNLQFVDISKILKLTKMRIFQLHKDAKILLKSRYEELNNAKVIQS